jgi:hypothetical protein
VSEPLDADAAEVLRRERALLDPQVRADPDAVLDLLHPDFAEIGASGRLWDGPSVAASMAQSRLPGGEQDAGARAAEIDDVVLARLAPEVLLLTYRLLDRSRPTRRSSTWLRDPRRGWVMRFHQGTVLPE